MPPRKGDNSLWTLEYEEDTERKNLVAEKDYMYKHNPRMQENKMGTN